MVAVGLAGLSTQMKPDPARRHRRVGGRCTAAGSTASVMPPLETEARELAVDERVGAAH